jgi:luciferase-type oxidoreductase
VLSNGRFVLGLATGDRPLEYGLFGAEYANRGERFRTTVERLPGLWAGDAAAHRSFGGIPFEMAPPPAQRRLPQVVVGRAQQSLEWIAAHADGWFSYAGSIEQLTVLNREWKAAQQECGCADKPLMMALRVMLEGDRNAPLSYFPMGVRAGIGELKRYLDKLYQAGIAHVALNLRMSVRPVAQVLEEIGREGDLLNG